MYHAAHVVAIIVHRFHGFHRGPVRDGGELRNVAPYLPKLLHAKAARLLLDLENAVLVVVPEILVRMLPAGPPEPRPRNDRLTLRSGHQNLQFAGSVGLQVHPYLPSPSPIFQECGNGTRLPNPFRDAPPWSRRR